MTINDIEIISIIEGGYREPYTLTYEDENTLIPISIPMFIEGYETRECCEKDKDKGIVITIDELIDIINKIEFRNMSDDVYELDDEEESDLKNLQKEFKDLGVIVSLNELYETHLIYSDSVCASWIGNPSADEEIYCLIKGIYDARQY